MCGSLQATSLIDGNGRRDVANEATSSWKATFECIFLPLIYLASPSSSEPPLELPQIPWLLFQTIQFQLFYIYPPPLFFSHILPNAYMFEINFKLIYSLFMLFNFQCLQNREYNYSEV